MPPVAQYTESQFAVYLTDMLDKLADVLGWDSGDPHVRESVTDALLEYGTTDISTITGVANLLKLRALGRRAIWRAVAAATAGFYSITDNGQKLERQQINAQALKMVTAAEDDCRAAGIIVGVDLATFAVSILAVRHPNDPYSVLPDDERVAS